MRALAAIFAAGLAILTGAGAASAQEDFEKGKSAAELFAKDCAICHKTPQAVVKGGPPGEGFLRQHYTSSSQSAASLAAYLRGIKPPATTERAARPKSGAKAAKSAGSKPAASDSKAADKPSDTKAAEPKTSEPKAAEPKAAEPNTSEKKDQPSEKKE